MDDSISKRIDRLRAISVACHVKRQYAYAAARYRLGFRKFWHNVAMYEFHAWRETHGIEWPND